MDVTGTVTNALAAGAAGSQAVTLADYAVNIGEFAVVAGNDQPTYITAATTGSGATTAITLNEANKYATAAVAPLTVYKACVAGAAYAAGYVGRGRPDRLGTLPPQIGQLVAFGTGCGPRDLHGDRVLPADSAAPTGRHLPGVYVDRPLEQAINATATSAIPARPAH